MPRGSAGEDEKGSKAGRRDAGRLTPATGGTGVIFRLGEGAMIAVKVEEGDVEKQSFTSAVHLSFREKGASRW
jgi:hypothetical protein